MTAMKQMLHCCITRLKCDCVCKLCFFAMGPCSFEGATLQSDCYSKLLLPIAQSRYIKILTWFRGLGEENTNTRFKLIGNYDTVNKQDKDSPFGFLAACKQASSRKKSGERSEPFSAKLRILRVKQVVVSASEASGSGSEWTINAIVQAY